MSGGGLMGSLHFFNNATALNAQIHLVETEVTQQNSGCQTVFDKHRSASMIAGNKIRVLSRQWDLV
jgi:hypothetical protein